jgi:tricorn protease
MTRLFPTKGLWRLTLGLLAMCLGTAARAEPDGHTLMRYPTLSGNTIVFVAHDNLWSVSRTGGTASRLTAEDGRDVMPRFSPDGRWIAFTGEYQGNRDVYVIPAAGGAARRLTFTSDLVPEESLRAGPNNMVVAWTPDSKSIVFLSRRMAWNNWINRLFAVPVSGGQSQLLPLDRGGFLSYSPDGKQIAYNRIFRNFRTWKRYDGGLAQDIDIYDFQTRKLTSVTNWPGTETFPMWSGKTIYFLSDHDAHRRANIWAYDTGSHEFREITHYTDFDIDFPSLGTSPGGGEAAIVFQQGGKLHVLDIPSEQVHDLDVIVPDDGTRTGPRWVDAKPLIREQGTAQQTDYDIAPNGARVVLSARGDIFTLPAEHGNTRNLTQTSNADEDHPSWSPDGKIIAYTTDISDEQQIAIRSAEGGAERILTHFPRGYFYTPRWSPAGDHLIFSDNEHRLWIIATAGGEPQQIAQDPFQEIQNYTWAPDGRWVAYVLTGANQQSGIWLYNLETRQSTRLSDPRSNDFNPVFDAAGKYLYFISTRHENPTFSRTEFNIATLKMAGVYVATLKRDASSPFEPQSDEGVAGSHDAGKEDEEQKGQGGVKDAPGARQEAGGGKGSGGGKGVSTKEPPKPLRIDFDGLMERALPLPIAPAEIGQIDVRGDKVFYFTGPIPMIEGPLPGEKSALRVYDMKAHKDAVVVEGLSTYVLSADGKKVAYKVDADYFIADAEAGAKDDSRKKVDLGHMRVRIEPRQEWAEMFNSAWRLERDFFFEKEMNGVDWNAVRAAYAPLVPLAGSRGDVNYLIGEILGEMSNSHTYVGGGDALPDEKRVPTGFLGADFALDDASGRYRFETIYPGDNSRAKYRSPLTGPGLDIRAGQYLLAIDGEELRAPTDPYSLLVGKQDQTVTLTIADSPRGPRHEFVVQTVKSELPLREQAWIEHNRELVDKASGGRIAYVYLSDMSNLGMEQFVRQFYGQLDKQALLIDDRWNGGGFIDQIVLERLRRVLVGMMADRERTGQPEPQQLIVGPKACLLNHYSASDGDIFPFYFRKYGLGPLLGTRSWGGVRGIRGEWGLLDGGYITVPEFAMYGVDSQWVIENHGVDPDVTVDDTPADWLAGHDVQLEAGIHYLVEELQKHPGGLPPVPPALPAYPPPGAKQN